MIVITKEQIGALEPYIENIEEIISQGDVQRLLDAIDDVIVNNILANDDEPDRAGVMIQKIWDAIFDQNE